MLQSIRDHTQGWIAGVIVSLLILSFALWGIHSYFQGASTSDVVAKVNGVTITKAQLAASYERLHRQLQMQSNNISLDDVHLKEHALQALIGIEVLKKAAAQQDYRISSNQVDTFLQNMPAFQVNGEFSLSRFQQAMSALLFTPADFLEFIKTTLLIEQPHLGIILTSYALPNEINDSIALIGQERKVQYFIIPENYFAKELPPISDESIKKYYADHQNEFKTVEQISIEYVSLSAKELADNIHPTDAQLKSFYTESGNSQPYEKAKAELKEAFVRQKAQEQFADLRDKLANLTYEHPESLEFAAKQLGLAVKTSSLFTQAKGNDKITANNKIRAIAFSHDVLVSQNNSDIIQLNPDTVMVLRIKSHLPPSLLPLSVVRGQIKDVLNKKMTEEKLSQFAHAVQEKLQNRTLSPAEVNTHYHLSWSDVGWVGRHAGKINQTICDAVFAMPKPTDDKLVYAVTKVGNGFAVISLSDVKTPDVNVPKEQYQAFAEQIQNSAGALEYEMYKNSLIQQAKVVIENE